MGNSLVRTSSCDCYRTLLFVLTAALGMPLPGSPAVLLTRMAAPMYKRVFFILSLQVPESLHRSECSFREIIAKHPLLLIEVILQLGWRLLHPILRNFG